MILYLIQVFKRSCCCRKSTIKQNGAEKKNPVAGGLDKRRMGQEDSFFDLVCSTVLSIVVVCVAVEKTNQNSQPCSRSNRKEKNFLESIRFSPQNSEAVGSTKQKTLNPVVTCVKRCRVAVSRRFSFSSLHSRWRSARHSEWARTSSATGTFCIKHNSNTTTSDTARHESCQ